ncbi:unnamed protein product [Linum trigynum]|uniref:Replication protein A OB domain-containing protein n=1 Tax=Linum trigynum TaxID=586398 RepID=A0AAV2CWY1_9ROSI
MEFTLLCNLGGPCNAGISLRLCLLHVWPSKSPGDNRIYNYCTLWTDETGMLIQWLLRFVVISRFPVDAYEFVVFSQLGIRADNHRYLTDVVGRLPSISGISHKITNNGTAVKQTVIIEDESGSKVTITLWDEFSAVLDHVALTQADSIEAVILAFGGLLVNKLGDDYVLSSSSATRIAVNPPVPKAYYLASRFAEKHETVASLPVEFATAADATADADRRTKTLGSCWPYLGRIPRWKKSIIVVIPLDDPTVVGDLLEFSSPRPSPPPSLGAVRSVGGPSGSPRFPSPATRILRDPIPASVGSEDIDAGSRILRDSQLSVMGVQVGSILPTATVIASSAVQSSAPSVPPATSMVPKRSARIDESMSPQDVGRDSSMPASKILKPSHESSPGKPLGSIAASPSASLLVSPLARIKVEKLDAADVAQVPLGGPSQAGVSMERDSSVDSQKNSAAKRALFKK